MIDKAKLKRDLSKIYNHKRISYKTYNIILSKLEQFKEVDPFFYTYQTGKFITRFGDADLAISYLTCAKDFKCQEKSRVEASIYYNLYKCYVKTGDYKNAFACLYTSKELSGERGCFSLPLNMLASIVDMEADFDFFMSSDYVAQNNNKLYFSELKSSYYSSLYNQIINSFNSKDYDAMLKTLELLKFSADDSNYPIEVESLVSLGRVLKEKKENHYKDMLDSDDAQEMSLEEYLKIAQDLLDAGMPVKKFFVEADKYIKTDIERAQAIYDLICSREYPYYDAEKDYLKNAIREQREYLALPDSIACQYEQLKTLGDKAFVSGNYILAEEKYREAFSISMLSVSDYYIGKALYKQGKLSKAKEHLDNYALNGGSKYERCLLYLGSINGVFERKAVVKKQVRLLERLNDSFQRDFDYKSLSFYSSYASKRREFNPEFDRYKNSVSKQIVMKEEDFASEESSASLEDFYDCDLDGKLSIIKNCLRHGQTDVANHLLDNLGPVYNFSDIDKVNQFQKNKKIYRNQKRTD